MLDENAFGFYLVYLAAEDDEYALDREEFVERFSIFQRTVSSCLRDDSPAKAARALDLGHAVYLEFAEGEELGDPIAWLKSARQKLKDAGFDSVGVLSHGSRWVKPDGSVPAEQSRIGDVPLFRFGAPSEPLRRALYAEAACVGEDDSEDAWGPGLYVDTEAIEALGRTLKNAPTPLSASGATFYRVSR